MGCSRKCKSAHFARMSLLSGGAAAEENLVECDFVPFYE